MARARSFAFNLLLWGAGFGAALAAAAAAVANFRKQRRAVYFVQKRSHRLSACQVDGVETAHLAVLPLCTSRQIAYLRMALFQWTLKMSFNA